MFGESVIFLPKNWPLGIANCELSVSADQSAEDCLDSLKPPDPRRYAAPGEAEERELSSPVPDA
jgi:hypothetical protein